MSTTTRPQRARNQILRSEKLRRQTEAKARQEAAAARTPQEQLARLNYHLFTATKERAKLNARIAAAQPAATTPEKPSQTAPAPIRKAQKGQKARKGAHTAPKAPTGP